VEENSLIRGKVSGLIRPLMDIHFEKVDKAFSPGLTIIHWISINLDPFIAAAESALKELDLTITRITDICNYRILQSCEDIASINLVYLPETSTSVTEFYTTTCEMCDTASTYIETKSESVERAVGELIDFLTGPDLILETFEDDSEPGALSVRKTIEQRTRLLQEAESLRGSYEQVVVDAQVRLLRVNLERLRKRMSFRHISYDETNRAPDNPVFESDLILAIPNIVMNPSLEGIQQIVSSTVSTILSTTKLVYRWGQVRNLVPHPPAQVNQGLPAMIRSRLHLASETSSEASSLKAFYPSITGNKEIQKLVTSIGTTLNSTRRVILASTDKFNKYAHLWELNRDEKMRVFMEEQKPGVNEFRMEMNEYAKLGDVIEAEPDVIVAGTVALNTEKLKLALMIEMKAWIVSYGRTMSHKYQLLMETVFKSIDEWTKMLSHPLSDLEDVRTVMNTLKEIREKEIQVDMTLDPIEVCCGVVSTG
jgi:dynein heavy chain